MNHSLTTAGSLQTVSSEFSCEMFINSFIFLIFCGDLADTTILKTAQKYDIWHTHWSRIYQHVSPDRCQRTGDVFKVSLYGKITAGSVVSVSTPNPVTLDHRFHCFQTARICFVTLPVMPLWREVKPVAPSWARWPLKPGDDTRLDPPQCRVTLHLAWVTLGWCG